MANGTDIDTVEFDPIVFAAPQVIALTLGQITISGAVTINGPGEDILTVDAQQDSRIFDIVAATGDFTINDVTLTGGRTTGDGLDIPDITFRGGAIRSLTSGTLSILRGTITANSTEGNFSDGGAIFATGDVSLTDSTVSNNSAAGFGSGGAGINSQGAVTLVRTEVTGNNTTGSAGGGVGVHATGDVTATSSTLSDNHATGSTSFGGAVFSLSDVTLTQSTVSGNSTAANNSDGGGIWASGMVTLNQSSVENNSTSGYGSDGGGIFSAGAVLLNQSTVSGNSTAGDNAEGGGIAGSVYYSVHVTLIDSIVSGNSTSGNLSPGGGIFSSGIVTITESVVLDNSTTGDNSRGGGINSAGDVLVTDSAINGNSTTGSTSGGGGVFSHSNVDLTLSIVSDNIAAGSATSGGGISALESVTLDRSTVHGNSTLGSGGGIFSSENVTLTDSTVSGNEATGGFSEGGGIRANLDVILHQSTVSGNRTTGNNAAGGGVAAHGAITLNHSTVTDNHVVDGNGGGLQLYADLLTAYHSIIAGNTDSAGHPDVDVTGGTVDVDWSLIGDVTGISIGQLLAITGGNGNLISVDPELGPLADHGGPTKTRSLLFGSPAIDAGDPAIVANPAEFDQRGDPFLRVVQGKQGGGAVIDMGAYERQAVAGLSLIVDTADDESDGDYTLGDLSLREAIGLANGSLGADTITFDPDLAKSTIALELGELRIVESVSVTGLGASLITVDAQQNSRVLDVDDGDSAAAQNVEISGLTLTGGYVDTDGAGIRSRENLALLDAHVTGNTVVGPGLGNDGGGLYVRMFGGMTTTIAGSTISANTTTGTGGGLFSLTESGDTIEVINSTVSGNEADLTGGGLRITGTGATTIAHGTIAFNTGDANTSGLGGVGGISDSTGLVTLDHTIVANNEDTTGPEQDLDGTFTANFSLVGDTTGATINGANNLLDVNQKLDPLSDNGGQTPTHALIPDSPAVDAGDAGFAPPPNYDQRGTDYERVHGAAIDIGAYELLLADGNLDGQVDGLDYLLWAQFFGDDPAQDPPGSPENGDYNNDGVVNGLDYLIWAGQFGAGTAVAANTPATETALIERTTAVDAALESEYEADTETVNDRDARAWQLGRAYDSLITKIHEKRRDRE